MAQISTKLLRKFNFEAVAAFKSSLLKPLQNDFPGSDLPEAVQRVRGELQRMEQLFNGLDGGSSHEAATYLPEQIGSQFAYFKPMLLIFRRHLAIQTEKLKAKTFHRELLETIQRELKVIDAVITLEWFKNLPAYRLPRLKDFVSAERIERHLQELKRQLKTREYDEKFHTLLAPSLFFDDLDYYRTVCCDFRETPVAVAFLDIDGFKHFNTAHGETTVDTNVLPMFMQKVEGHLYGHGHAYRQGGDEYLVILPSASRGLALFILDELRMNVARIDYPGVPEKTTVSVGVCVIEPDCPFTDHEVLGFANRAKKHAKDAGKNRISAYRTGRFDPSELEVVRGMAIGTGHAAT